MISQDRFQLSLVQQDNDTLHHLLEEVIIRAPESLPIVAGGCCEVYLPKELLDRIRVVVDLNK